jgi:hypothetical protein
MDNTSQVKLVPIPAVIAADWWPAVHGMVEDACNHSNGKYCVSDVLAFIQQQRMQLWVALHANEICAVGISELVQYPQIKVCRMLAATGNDRELWENLIEEMEAWGRSVGAGDMELICRPGWERVMKKYGYEKTHVILNKRLGYAH